LHEIAELRRHRIAVHGCQVFAGIAFRELLGDTIPQFDQRLRDALVQNGHLRRFVAALQVHAELPRTIEDLCGLVAQFRVVEKLLHVAKPVAPALVAIARENTFITNFSRIIK
ncbi:MAG: hypothetical protein ACK56I_30405, partial [bacterium]